MKDLTITGTKATIILTKKQVEILQPLFNNVMLHNNSMIISQLYADEECGVVWLSPIKARILYIVVRLLGIKRVTKD